MDNFSTEHQHHLEHSQVRHWENEWLGELLNYGERLGSRDTLGFKILNYTFTPFPSKLNLFLICTHKSTKNFRQSVLNLLVTLSSLNSAVILTSKVQFINAFEITFIFRINFRNLEFVICHFLFNVKC